MSKFYDFCEALRAGHYDDNLETMKNLLTDRRSKLAQLNMSAVVPDSHVIIVGNIRPVYLVGHIAKVTKVNQTTVSISFLQPIYGTGGRAHPIKDCRVPITCCEPVSQAKVDEYVKNIKPIKAYGPTAMRNNRWNPDRAEAMGS
jgi:hypothetical protein